MSKAETKELVRRDGTYARKGPELGNITPNQHSPFVNKELMEDRVLFEYFKNEHHSTKGLRLAEGRPADAPPPGTPTHMRGRTTRL